MCEQSAFVTAFLQNSLFDLTPPGALHKTVLAPDIAILRQATLRSRKQIPTDPPLLAIEVVSPSQTLVELGVKAQFYRNAGVDEVWLIDQETRVIEIWNAQGTTTLTEAQTLTSALLPSFSLVVADVLDG